jgi:fructose-bisphosphate aldolase class II
MLDAAQKGGYAYPAVNITSLTTINAALKAFADSKTDGIIQVSTGGGQFASGLNVADAAFGAIVLAEATHLLAEKYDVLVALHTDHCHPEKVDGFLKPLLEASRKRVAEGKGPLFQSHMFDGSVVPLDENLKISKELLKECADLGIILEVEAGCVGGEEDGHDTSGLPIEKLYTTPEDMVEVYEALQPLGRFLFAATFGNVHGAYKPGSVKLKPTILRDGQKAVMDKHGAEAEMDLVFHGGSGSELSDIRETLDYGVVKMNIDTDTQFAYATAVGKYVEENERAFKYQVDPDNDTPYKKQYDPRVWVREAELSMAARLEEAFKDLGSTGKSIAKG